MSILSKIMYCDILKKNVIVAVMTAVEAGGKTVNNAFNQSLIDYPVWSFIWEFIKIIIPTGVAIAAIVANNKRAENRDKENMKRDLYLKWRYELLDNMSELSIMVDKVSEAYINIMDAYDIDKCQEYYNIFKSSHFKYTGHVRKVADFSDAINISTDVMNAMNVVKDKATEYVETLLNIKQKYRPRLDISIDEDKELQEVNKITQEMYSALNTISKIISDEIIKLLE